LVRLRLLTRILEELCYRELWDKRRKIMAPWILAAMKAIQARNEMKNSGMFQGQQPMNQANVQLPQNQVPTITSVYSNLWR
jgi:hypothetical protein